MKKPPKRVRTGKVVSWGVIRDNNELRVVSSFSRTHAMRQGIWYGPAEGDYRNNLQEIDSDNPLNAWERKAWKRLRRENHYELVRVTHSYQARSK